MDDKRLGVAKGRPEDQRGGNIMGVMVAWRDEEIVEHVLFLAMDMNLSMAKPANAIGLRWTIGLQCAGRRVALISRCPCRRPSSW